MNTWNFKKRLYLVPILTVIAGVTIAVFGMSILGTVDDNLRKITTIRTQTVANANTMAAMVGQTCSLQTLAAAAAESTLGQAETTLRALADLNKPTQELASNWFTQAQVLRDNWSRGDGSDQNACENLRQTSSGIVAAIEAQMQDEVQELWDLKSLRRSFFIAVGVVYLLLVLGISQWIISSIDAPIRSASTEASTISNAIDSMIQTYAESLSGTAAAMNETTVTVDEIRVTAEETVNMAETVRESMNLSTDAIREMNNESISVANIFESIQSEVNTIATQLLDLSEQHGMIREILHNVTDIAEQSNLLAVNASIEAAKAGDAGRGFSVVAVEIKQLAGQSKEATTNIARILKEIQDSSNALVMVTEQGTKRVDEGQSILGRYSATFEAFRDVMTETIEMAAEIAQLSQQQLSGISQINDSFNNINTATQVSLENFEGLESTASAVSTISDKLRVIVDEQ